MHGKQHCEDECNERNRDPWDHARYQFRYHSAAVGTCVMAGAWLSYSEDWLRGGGSNPEPCG
jgi:hypothetical protein